MYGPNTDDPSVFLDLFEACETFGGENLILGGDFNFRFNLSLDHDSRARRIANNHRCKAAVLQYMAGRKLVDIWRNLHPNVRSFTFHRGLQVRSRIDFFLISESYLYQVKAPEADIQDGYLSDHKMCTLKVCIGGISIGRSYWKFNNTLLLDEEFVVKTKDRISEIVKENDSDDLSRVLLLQTVLCVLRGWIINISSAKKREREKKQSELDLEINRISVEESESSRAMVQKLREQRDQYIADITKGNMLRCRANWRQYGEKGTKYFHGLIKRNRYQTVFESMELCNTDPGKKTTDIKEMLKECSHYFEQLYCRKENNIATNDVFDNLALLCDEDSEMCEGRLTETEIAGALAGMSVSSSPGPDGFTVPFFKHFWSELKDIILSAFEEIYSNGHMPTALKSSVTVLLPKKNKDRTKVSSLRPISLLNVVYKILTKALTSRVHCVINKLICSDQTGFIKGRFIGENVRLLIDVLRTARTKRMPGMVIFCDWKQAYDTVSWDFIKRALKEYGFGPMMRRWVDILYDSSMEFPSTAQVQLNGHLSSAYVIQRGLRQGCPLSCYLFLLSAEPLAEMIRQNRKISGLTFNHTEIKISSYADDTIMMLDGSPQSLRECMKCVNIFQEASGLHLNRNKTQAVWIGARSSRKDTICPEIDIQWTTGPLEYLGIKLNATGNDLAQLNYPDKINKVKQRLNIWHAQDLTGYGKTHLLRTEALSQLVYTMTVIEKPTLRDLKEINTLLFKFIWNNKRDTVKRSILKSRHSIGGLKVPDPSIQADSLKAIWIKKSLDDRCNAKWKAVMKDKLLLTPNVSIFQCKMSKQQAMKHFDSHFWAETYEAWSKAHAHQAICASDALAEILWKNKEMCLEEKGIMPVKSLMREGVIKIGDLYNFMERRFMTPSELSLKYQTGNFLTWHSMLSAIPCRLRDAINRERPKHPHEIKPPVFLGEFRSKSKPCKWVYKELLQLSEKREITKQQSKWQDEINDKCINWEKTYTEMYSVTNDFELRWFQYRLLQRFLLTNRLLYLYKLIDKDECPDCPGISETYAHLFWHCHQAQHFWTQVKSFFGLKGDLNLRVIITGIYSWREEHSPRAIALCLLLAKRYLWRSRRAAQSPCIQEFVPILTKYVRTERYVAINEGKVEEFSNMWSKVLERTGIG